MFIIYDLIFLALLLVYLPVYLLKGKFHKDFWERLGFLPKGLNAKGSIWVHAVSVGEVMAIRGLIEELRKIYPDKKFIISTVTVTGNKIARGIAKEGDFVTYLPLDLSFIVRRVIERARPALFIIAETEIWPSLITCLYKRNIPIITVNGRVSDASFRGYLSIKFLLKPILNKISLFCVQSERDAGRLTRLGVPEEKIRVTGNMKFDTQDYPDGAQANADYRLKLGLAPEDKLLVAGSTHDGEEEEVLEVYKGLQKSFPHLKLLIAPRHPERSKAVAQVISKFGFRSAFISSSPLTCSTCITDPVFVLDEVGKLVSFYAASDIVFVGGSLIKKGGHNILEPASLSKPILFGPHMFNFRDIADLFLNNRAAIAVRDKAGLEESMAGLLNDPLRAAELGKRARQLITQNRGATKRNAEYIKAVYSLPCGRST
ncbi:MAG: 3-deoxy-D-manno-octulosonic acid transferase [Candidatus Omnitrophota bacterium]